MRAMAQVNGRVLKRVEAKIRERVEKARPHSVSVGIHEKEGEETKINYQGFDSTITVIQAALIHEYGAGIIPERSFLRSWFDRNIARLRREAVTAMRAEYAGDRNAVENQAKQWATDLYDWVAQDDAGLTPLAPRTVAEREAAGIDPGPPLYATGQLMAAIRAVMDGNEL